MADIKTYEVLRPQEGDRLYHKGDLRDLPADEAAPLVKMGALRLADKSKPASAKADQPAVNKAVRRAPRNKSK